MKRIYTTREEIINAATEDGMLTGIVELSFSDLIWNTDGVEFVNETATNQMVTEKYGYKLMDIRYRIVSFDLQNQTVFIEVTANAYELLDEMEEEQ